MARRTKEEAEETRLRILAAAVDLFYEHGVANSSLAMIAERAGVTRGAIYWHFKNKLELFRELHGKLHNSVIDDLSNLEAMDDSFLLPRLREFTIAFLKSVAGDTSRRRVYTVFALKCDYSGEMRAFLDNQGHAKAEGLALISTILEKAQRNGEIPATSSPYSLAISYLGYVSGLCDLNIRNPSLYDLDKNANQLVDAFFAMMKVA